MANDNNRDCTALFFYPQDTKLIEIEENLPKKEYL